MTALKIGGIIGAALAFIFVVALGASGTPQQDKNCPTNPSDSRCDGWVFPTTTTTTLPTTTTDPTTTIPTTTTTTDSTTTTVPSSTTTTGIPAPSFGRIGVTGCSNTNLATKGYLDASSLDLLVPTAVNGATVKKWASGSSRTWSKYDAGHPYDAAWVNLCERSVNNLTVANVEAILSHIWSLDPGIPVFVSPLNFYDGDFCTMTEGNSVPEAGAVLADQMAAGDPLVFRGPDLGPLGLSQVTTPDLCHPNDDGVAELGAQLEEFFDQ